VVAKEANPPDQPISPKVDRRPLADPVVTPTAHECFDLLRGAIPVEGGHVGEELGLRVDLR
jgi:hypothetical protein